MQELTYVVSIVVTPQRYPESAYITAALDDTCHHGWVADTRFGPFDTWVDLVQWIRKQMSVDLEHRLR